jgi:hypothetical protein
VPRWQRGAKQQAAARGTQVELDAAAAAVAVAEESARAAHREAAQVRRPD